MVISSGRSDNHQSFDENPPTKYSDEVPGSDIQIVSFPKEEVSRDIRSVYVPRGGLRRLLHCLRKSVGRGGVWCEQWCVGDKI